MPKKAPEKTEPASKEKEERKPNFLERKRFVDYSEPETKVEQPKPVVEEEVFEAPSGKPAKAETVKAAAPPKKAAEKEDSDEWGAPEPSAAKTTAVAATAVAATAAAATVAATAQKEATDSDYSADWGEQDLEDKSSP